MNITPYLLCSALLSACCTPRIVIKEVNVPIITPCIESSPTKPVFPLQEASPEEDLFSLTKKSLAEIELRKGYEGELESAIIACKK